MVAREGAEKRQGMLKVGLISCFRILPKNCLDLVHYQAAILREARDSGWRSQSWGSANARWHRAAGDSSLRAGCCTKFEGYLGESSFRGREVASGCFGSGSTPAVRPVGRVAPHGCFSKGSLGLRPLARGAIPCVARVWWHWCLRPATRRTRGDASADRTTWRSRFVLGSGRFEPIHCGGKLFR